jgi:hypothetical protein
MGGKMTIKCIVNKSNHDPIILPQNLSEQISDMNFVSSSEFFTVDSGMSGYRISLGKKYTVMGLIIFNNELRYLISDDNNIPGFFPSDLFEIADPNILFDWEINLFQIENQQLFVVGYTELAQNYAHLVGLIDSKKQEVKKYLDYKAKQIE